MKGETAKGENLFILRISELENSIRGNSLGKQLLGIPYEEMEKGNSEGKP